MSIKNLWSLNIDELLVASEIKENLKKTEYDIFFPLNSQMKDIDLLLLNLKNNRATTLQIKGSRTYTPKKSEVERYGNGSAAWFKISKKSIYKPHNKVNFYVFVLHSFYDGKIKKEIRINYLIIPIKKFREICRKKALRKGNFYHFFIWIDPRGKRAFDFNNRKGNDISLSRYIDNWKLIK